MRARDCVLRASACVRLLELVQSQLTASTLSSQSSLSQSGRAVQLRSGSNTDGLRQRGRALWRVQMPSRSPRRKKSCRAPAACAKCSRSLAIRAASRPLAARRARSRLAQRRAPCPPAEGLRRSLGRTTQSGAGRCAKCHRQGRQRCARRRRFDAPIAAPSSRRPVRHGTSPSAE